MPTVRYTGGGTYRVAGVGFGPGDEKNVDDELADYLADRDDFEVVDDVDHGDVREEDGPPDDESEGGVEPPFDPSEHTVDELTSELEDGDYGGSKLHALSAVEEDRKDRETAIEAIEAHIPDDEEA
jgi:hypothetical protein